MQFPTITILFILTYTYNSIWVHIWFYTRTSYIRKPFGYSSPYDTVSDSDKKYLIGGMIYPHRITPKRFMASFFRL